MKTTQKKLNQFFVLIVFSLTVFLWFLPTGFENEGLIKNTLREKGEILSVNNNEIQKIGIMLTGSQTVSVRILSGKFKGDTVQATNILMGQKKIDKIFSVGDKILVILKITPKGNRVISARADSKYRINIQIVLFTLFAIFLILFSGWTGFKALISFIFTAMTIWKILIPSFLRGYSPLMVSFLIVSVVTAVIILLISNFTRKGLTALLGSVLGIGITTLLAVSFGYFFQIHGTVKEFSEILFYAGFDHLNLTEIFISGIFISAAGAVMDVAMDIAASQQEIYSKKNDISPKELILSGFRVAHAVIGTMTTTLLFAYSGSFTFVLMAFMAKGTPMINIFNLNYISAEILQTLVGSFGLVLVAPITAILGGYIYTFKKKPE